MSTYPRFPRFLLAPLFILTLLLAACVPTTPSATSTAPPTEAPPVTASPTPAPTTPPPTSEPIATGAQPDHLLISEVLGGKKGNNNFEFIELYNPTSGPLDLQGYSLWYRLGEKQEPVRIARWTTSVLVPAHGHFLLVRDGQDMGLEPDATFDQAINLSKGGLELRDAEGNRVDALGWGAKAPPSFTEGQPAPSLVNGQSLERLPGGEKGNAQDSDENAADFVLREQPSPQNTASDPTPAIAKRLIIAAEAPETIEPGSDFAYTFTITNHTGETLHDLVAILQLPKLLKVGDLPDGVSATDQGLEWRVDALEDNASVRVSIPVSAPWTYVAARLQSYQVKASDWPNAAAGPTVTTRIEGGVIPIATARTLQGAQLTIEGVATMYTGGYYAGGGNVKFYMEDDTAGIQVQVFGGQGVVSVHIGDKVRVKGTIGAYRGATQIVPDVVPDDIEILQKADPEHLPQPQPVSIADALKDETLLGRLVQVEGTVTRNEEFTYSYGIDLADKEGNILTLYVDKGTHINPETIEKGQLYRASGILEIRDGKVQLYPRVQSDLVEVFPPILRVTADAPLSVQPGQPITYTGSVFNHTPDPMTQVVVTAKAPTGAKVLKVSEGGKAQKGQVTWRLKTLPPEGGRADVWFIVSAPTSGAEAIEFAGFSATAEQWPEPATSPALITFLSDTVPIWAIQGPGDRSPYVMKWVEVEGVVTGAFPDLPGFFIQDLQPDKDPDTSEGIFVNTIRLEDFPTVAEGDIVRIWGQVRETSQQTQLMVEAAEDIQVVEEDAPLPDPIPLDPPTAKSDANRYYERMEGMLVAVKEPAVAVSPTSKYGEYVIVLAKHGVDRLWRWQHEANGIAIMVDDGSSERHDDRSTLDYVVYTGDHVSDVVGPLAFTYDNYKIEPVAPPQVDPISHTLPELPPLKPNQFAIMTWNAENVFDAKPPNPSNPPLPSPAEYRLALAKMADTIRRAGYPTIVGLQEIENIEVLEDLAQQDAILEQAYQPVLIEGFDSRGIDVGYLVRGDAEILDVQQYNAPEGLTSRPPLLIKVNIDVDGEKQVVYVINNHFTSMSAGVEITEPRRTAQAEWNVHILKDIILAQDPEARVAIIGDLNSFFDAWPIQVLRDAGLDHVLDDVRPDQRYNYIYQGESQVLDHILITRNLFQQLRATHILHVNADFPPPKPDDPSAERKSDHDPIIAIFE